MPQCQCFTKEGKGPQCEREVPEGERYCWQHKNCRTPVGEGAQNAPAKATKKVPTKKTVVRPSSPPPRKEPRTKSPPRVPPRTLPQVPAAKAAPRPSSPPKAVPSARPSSPAKSRATKLPQEAPTPVVRLPSAQRLALMLSAGK